MAHTPEMLKLLKEHGYPNKPEDPLDPADIFCNVAETQTAMDATEEDYGGQTQVCLTCGKAWSCGYGGSDRRVNDVVCPKTKISTPETCVLGNKTSIYADHKLWMHITDKTKEPEISKIHGYHTGNYNILIAKFMGNHNVKDLAYDTDWNELMYAVEKIESLGYSVIIASYQTQIYGKNREFIIDADFSNTFLENTYQAVWSFIEWYNKKQTC